MADVANELRNAIEHVSDAILRHAEVCERQRYDPRAVVEAGEEVSRAVVAYEGILSKVTGWSSPLRHLGPLLAYRDESESSDRFPGTPELLTPPLSTRAELVARYQVILSDEGFLAFVNGRLGRELGSLLEALETLYKAEGWDPQAYPPGLMMVEAVEVQTSVVEA